MPYMHPRIPVIVNRTAGTAGAMGDRLADIVTAAFANADVGIDLRLVDGDAAGEAVAACGDAPVVVVGGGDGTLGAAAGVLAGTRAALGILPLGTRNHLARDLGLPLDLDGAAQVIATGAARTIDLGEANGRVFVNNASIGLYPALVRFRDAERDRHPIPKWLAALPASYAALKRIRHHRLRLLLAGSTEEIVTPMLFVGNNRYALEPGALGQRETLDDGTLSVFAVASRRRLALVGFAVRTLLGRIDPDTDFATIGEVAQLTVEGRSHDVDIALDGEVQRIAMPIAFRVRAGALRVLAPSPAAVLEGGAATP